MNLEYTRRLREPLQQLMDEGSRINTQKPQRYWYPLSIATYGVEEVLAAVDSMCSFRTTMWEKTSQFEKAFGSTFGHPEAVMVNSGSSADLLMAFALTNPAAKLLSPGDEILVPSVTWPTQIWSVMMAGLTVKMVDTDPVTLNVDLRDLEAKIGPRTRAVFAVHLMGNPCDMDALMSICSRHNLLLIEDCCESLGAKFGGQPVGTFGLAASYSFFFSHHITTMEGGMVGCADESLSDMFRLLRAHGWARNMKHGTAEPRAGIDPRYMFLNWGFNVRPTELQAGFGLEQLQRLPGFLQLRQKGADRFARFLGQHHGVMRLMQVAPKAECSWFALPIVLTEDCPFTKAEFLDYLEADGVETRPVVAGNLALQPVCDLYPDLRGEALPGADIVHQRGFYIGLHPIESAGTLDRLCETFDRFIRTRS